MIHEERMKLEEDKNSLLAYVEESMKERDDLLKEVSTEWDISNKTWKDLEQRSWEINSMQAEI